MTLGHFLWSLKKEKMDNVDKLADAILWAFENQERLKKDILETNKVDFWSNSAKQILTNSNNLGF